MSDLEVLGNRTPTCFGEPQATMQICTEKKQESLEVVFAGNKQDRNITRGYLSFLFGNRFLGQVDSNLGLEF